jgi:hypothetical protein
MDNWCELVMLRCEWVLHPNLFLVGGEKAFPGTNVARIIAKAAKQPNIEIILLRFGTRASQQVIYHRLPKIRESEQLAALHGMMTTPASTQ